MGRGNDSLSKGHDHILESERIHYSWMLNSIQRFRLFFCGLVFAVLSFSLQVGFDALPTSARVLYTCAWTSLLGAGVLALREAGGFRTKDTEESFEGMSPRWRKAMWALFLAGIALLGGAKWAS
jgi:hypothetical protein